jgi:hypothetical protein
MSLSAFIAAMFHFFIVFGHHENPLKARHAFRALVYLITAVE